MEKIGIFYGPTDGSVEKVANMLKEMIGEDKTDLIPVKNATAQTVNQYRNIIFGLSTVGKHTWDMEIADDWSAFIPQLEKIDYSGKIFALYGLGDHLTYALHFVDSLGYVAGEMMKHNAKIVGQVDPSGYDFQDSEAIIDGKFIGLPLDEDYESEKTPDRLREWLDIILKEFQ